ELAELCAIMFIDSNNYWLTSDGGYRKGIGMWHHLYDVKPPCTISEPPMNPAKADFSMAMKNLHVLMQKIGSPGYEKGKGFLFYDNSSPTPTRFKIRHCLFEVCSGTEHIRHHQPAQLSILFLTEHATYYHLQDSEDFLPQNFQLTREETCDELFELQKTHRMVPLQACGEDGYILSPTAYRSHLENAVVELQFNLWHWPITPRSGSTGKDSFTADIVQIHVLVLPPPLVSNSPMKRKIAAYVDLESSASAHKKERQRFCQHAHFYPLCLVLRVQHVILMCTHKICTLHHVQYNVFYATCNIASKVQRPPQAAFPE
ncbi:hypothetical protein PISMIDRAFT_114544, partial [Pisolithus microcarpus 441]